MLNIRCVSLSSDLIDLPHGCIKKKIEDLLCAVANVLVGISFHSLIQSTNSNRAQCPQEDWEYKDKRGWSFLSRVHAAQLTCRCQLSRVFYSKLILPPENKLPVCQLLVFSNKSCLQNEMWPFCYFY